MISLLRSKLKLPDAAHIACAIGGGCEYFISCDDEIVKRGEEIRRRYGIKVCNPVEFAKIEEGK